jgi:hypothetical protein
VKRRPSEGVIVEGSVLARLFGIRLLKLNATVWVGPADVAASPSGSHILALRPSAPRARVPPARSGGRSLADAVRNINEGAELLAEARRNGA